MLPVQIQTPGILIETRTFVIMLVPHPRENWDRSNERVRRREQPIGETSLPR